MTAGLALALASALGTNIAFLFKQRGALLAPPVRGRHPLRSAVGLFRSRWFSLGWAVAVAAWALHVGALALAPLSVVQAVLSGGLVFLGVLAERYFGFHLGRWQWAGMTITAFGLAVIAITGGRHTNAVRHYSPAALIAVECGVFALGAALIGISMHGRVDPAAEGLLLGVASGVLFGVSDIALKYLTEALQGGLDGIVSEWTLAALAASVLAFYASARGLQLGPGVAVIAFTSVAANLAAIMGGILVFRDPIGIGAASTAPRCLNKKLRFVAGAEPSARINPRNMVVMRQHAATRLSTSGRPIGAGGESGSTPLLPQRVSPILRGSARLLPCGYQVGRFRPTKQCQRS